MAGSVGQYTQAWFPFAANKANTNWAASNSTNSSVLLGMGYNSASTAAQNNEFNNDFWLDSVTWKVALVILKSSDGGIFNVQFDGVTQGTIDDFASPDVNNSYNEITNISVATPKIVNVKMLMATKNASSTGYRGYAQSVALIRTGGTPSTPGGTDTPGYTWEWIGWMGDKSETGTWLRGQDSTFLGGGSFRSGGATTDKLSTDTWSDSGTFTLAVVGSKGPSRGIGTYKLGATSIGTIDWYQATVSDNQFLTIAGVAISTADVKAFELSTPTKNAASADFVVQSNSMKWIRTGA